MAGSAGYIKRMDYESWQPAHYGGWARRPDHLTLQDVIIAEKI